MQMRAVGVTVTEVPDDAMGTDPSPLGAGHIAARQAAGEDDEGDSNDSSHEEVAHPVQAALPQPPGMGPAKACALAWPGLLRLRTSSVISLQMSVSRVRRCMSR